MSESEDEAGARKQRMRERRQRQDSKVAQESPVVGPNQMRKTRVARTSGSLVALAVLMWLLAYFVDVESEFGIHLVLFFDRLSWVFIGVAAIGWIVHEALPDD